MAMTMDKSMFHNTLHVVAVALGMLACGCSSAQIPATSVADSEKNLASAVQAFTASDFASGAQLAGQAIDGGGLSPDLYVQALLVRAASRAAQANFDEALADLDIAAQGAAEMDKVHGLRSLVLTAKGDVAAAAEELNKAKLCNKNLKLPTDVKKWDFSK